MNKKLRNKLIELFGVYIPESTSDSEVIKELNRRGLVDNKKLLEMIFILAEEISTPQKK